ncbi:MAG: hypothetical protein AB8I08_28720 [Sandaracinaceae bacterium]
MGSSLVANQVNRAVRMANGVREFPMRRRAIARRLDALGAGGVANWLQGWLSIASEPRARPLSSGVGAWLAERQLFDPDTINSLRRAAEGGGLVVVQALLRGGASNKSLPRRGRLPEARLTVGPYRAAFRLRRSWLCGAGDQSRLLDALEQHPDADFLKRFLSHPDPARRQSALAVALRRPTTPALVNAVLASRWIEDPRVVAALVENPFTPVGVASSFLPATGVRTVRLASRRGPPPLRQLAGLLLASTSQ